MLFINKILLEGLYADTDTIYDIDYYTKVPYKEIKKKTYRLAARFGVDKVYQAKTGSCYFIIFNPNNHFIYEVRVSNHPSTNKDKYYQTIELSYSQSLFEMSQIIKDTLKRNKN